MNEDDKVTEDYKFSLAEKLLIVSEFLSAVNEGKSEYKVQSASISLTEVEKGVLNLSFIVECAQPYARRMKFVFKEGMKHYGIKFDVKRIKTGTYKLSATLRSDT